jgi:hypothetical protein
MLQKLKIITLLLFTLPLTVHADDHLTTEMPASLTQVNLCYLNDGKTLSDVEKFNEKFFDWTRRENVEPYSLILMPLANASAPKSPTYHFIELLTGPYALIGNMWDKASSKEGQNLLSGWADIATCATRFAHLMHKYNDTEKTAGTDNRVVEFNRCKVHEGAAGSIKAKHDSFLASGREGRTNMYWGVMMAAAGGEPDVFRHLISYPDVTAYTTGLAARATPAGMTATREYNRLYAQCDGPSVWTGRVQNRPADR